MFTIKTTKQFDKEVKLCIKRGYDISKLKEAMHILEDTGTLPAIYRPHQLSGDYENCWECHLKGDWLLLWLQNDNELTLLFINTGTHSDLF